MNLLAFYIGLAAALSFYFYLKWQEKKKEKDS
jgi:uncharacterized membrane protein YuzA (DUF378 family)